MTQQDFKPPIVQEKLLTHLLNLSKRMVEIRTLGLLLDFIVSQMLNLVNAERGYVVVKSNDNLEFRLSRDNSGRVLTNQVDQVSNSILNHVFDNEQPLLVKNASLDPRFNVASSVLKLRLRSVMCVPLITNNSLIGAFYVENRAKSSIFSQRELEILEFFSHHAAVSIINADLNDNLESIVQERTQQLEEARDLAEQVSKAKTDFLAIVSHELRSPLTAISIYSELLERNHQGDLSPKQEKAIKTIKDNTAHILSLVNDLLDLDKIEAGLLDIDITEVDLASVLQEVVPTVESLLFGKSVVLNLSFPDFVPLVQADRKRVYQIFLNILSNAAKFTSNGHITVGASSLDEDFVLIRIEDSGIGIAEDEHDLVFQTYRQSRNASKYIGGIGLGLPITKRLVELQAGEIWFESTLDVGTTFFIKLPSAN